MAMPTAGASAVSPPAAQAARKLGLVAATSLVIGNMIGSGVFLLPSSLAPYGLTAIWGWAITAVGAILLALVFARLSRMMVGAGGPYAYTRAGFGDFAGFWIAWGYWIALWAGNAAIAVAFVGYAAAFFPALNRNGLLAAAAAIGLVWALTAVNLRGVGPAGRVQTVSTVVKLIPLAAMATIGLLWFSGANPTVWQPTAAEPNVLVAVQAVVALTLWSFLGLESASVASEGVENPTVTVPRATVLGTLVTAAVYMLSSVAIMGAVPGAALATSTYPFADAARIMWGDWAFYLVAFCAAVSCLGALNGFTLITPQVSAAAAADGLFPRRFGEMSRAGVPAYGLVVAGALVSVLLAINYSGSSGAVAIFNFIILLATLTTLLPYAFCAMAELILFVREPGLADAGSVKRDVAIAMFAFAYSLVAIVGSGASTVLWGMVLLLLGLPVYVWMVRERAHAPAISAD